MKSTREKILQTLLTHPQSTINDLAEAVDINAISVRHHLTNLQVDGYVKAEEERHGVGRPRLVYSLTDDGLEKFPTRYLQLTNRLLSQLKRVLPENQIQSLFMQIGKSIIEEQTETIKKMTIEQKLDFIVNILGEQGFAIEWQRLGDEIIISEASCPFYHVGQVHPEVCTMDQALISSILSIPTEKIGCLLNGDSHCAYVVKQKDINEENK